MVLPPEKRLEFEALYRTAPFPLYGLPPAWVGVRSIGAADWRPDSVQALRLVHSARLGEARSSLAVEMSTKARVLGGALETLAQDLWLVRGSTVETILARWEEIAPRRHLRSELPTPPMPTEGTASIPIDGEPTTFRLLAHGDRWIAGADLGGLFVRVRPNAFPLAAVELVRIEDVEPYIEGRRQLLR